MKETIIMCPTLERATYEWKQFCRRNNLIIDKANRNDLSVKFKDGERCIFKSSTQKLYGYHCDVIYIDDFIGENNEQKR